MYRSTLKITALLIIIANFCRPTWAHQSHLPDLGNEFRAYLSLRDEKIIGDHYMREVRAAGLLYPDPLVHEYVRYVGHRLTPHMPTPYAQVQPKFFAIQDKTVNAFAFFGGHVAVHSGLILLTGSEDELAGVMAHELAHVAQQHLIRQVAENKRALPLALAGSIAAAFIAGPEMMIPVLAGHMQHMVNFTRQHEQEADRVGMQILANAKYDPHGLPDIFERMSTNFRYEGKMPEYLSTHPLYESRIVDTRHRADILPHVRKTDSQTYHLIKARVAVQQADNLPQIINDLKHQIQTARYPNELAIKYALAYALHYNGKNKESLDQIYALAKKYPNNLIVQMTAAEIEAANNKFKEAQMRLEDLLTQQADSASLKIQYISLLVATSQAKLAHTMLDDYAQQHAPDLAFYELRRHAAGMLDNKVGVYEANAEWYILVGEYQTAISQLKNALGQPEIQEIAKARVELRIREMKDLIRTIENI